MTRFNPTMLAIHNYKQFFLDDLLIETVHKVTRNFHQPIKGSLNPVIQIDRPWERMDSGHGRADDKILLDFFRCCRMGDKPRSS